ncbi:MAG: hypothetical protein ACXVDJ_09945 [Tumebacillaceae bacterium]
MAGNEIFGVLWVLGAVAYNVGKGGEVMLERNARATGRETVKRMLREMDFDGKMRFAHAIEWVESDNTFLMEVHFPSKEERRVLMNEMLVLRKKIFSGGVFDPIEDEDDEEKQDLIARFTCKDERKA